MNTKALKTLEFDKILQMLSAHASSAAGRALCLALTPMMDTGEIRTAQDQTADALSRLFAKGSVSFGSTHDVRAELRRLEIGGALSAAELLRIASLLENVNLVKQYGRRDDPDDPGDSLSIYFDSLSPLTKEAQEIRRCILAEDEIADDASSALKQIRRQIRILQDRVHSELARLISGSGKEYLQDALVTMRDGRYCIPVRIEHRANVSGIIHDQSSSGNTLFIEPSSVVNLNNEIRQAQTEEAKEISAILAGLSASLSACTEEISENFEMMRTLDFIFARAHLAMEMNATRPLISDDGVIDLRRARHPLIPKKQVVPIDIRLGETFDLLVITGPNTGGKTVTLKTTGLLTLMGQAGLHIPAADRSRLAVFEDVLADIGDEQSIEQSLSTFSSHMKNVVAFLAEATDRSLVLFDELGAGTDPTEGAALAIAILNDLHARGIRTVATTHYAELKVYALRTAGVENASCEFDVDTLSPTYRLLIGIPGKSNAFAISRKLGLPEELIDEARAQISGQAESFEDILTSLENTRKKLEEEKETARRERAEIEALRKELKQKKEELSLRKSDLIRSSSEEARNILQNAKDYADRTIREFNKARESGADIRKLEEKRERLRKKIDNYGTQAAAAQGPKKKGNLAADEIRVGDRVRVLSLGIDAVVETVPDDKHMLFISSGMLRTKVSVKDLEKTADVPQAKGPGKSSSGNLRMAKSSFAASEINLLGRTVDEAVAELGKFLDDAYIARLPEVRIVHGKGTGALRAGIHKYLKKDKHVKEFRLGEYGEGDSGVTVAKLRS